MVAEELYILKHKDLDVAMVKISTFSGRIEYILEIYLPEELPVGCGSEGTGLIEWWNMRAVPDTRKGIQQALRVLNEETSQSLNVSGLWSEPDRPLLDAACFQRIVLEGH